MSNDDRRHEVTADPAVDAAWRRAAVDEPSARVDVAILEAARAATRGATQARPMARPGRRTWIDWRPIAAAATVAALAFLLVPRTEQQSTPHTAPAQGPVTKAAAPAAEALPAQAPPSRQEAASAEASATVPAPTAATPAPAAKSEPMARRAAAPPAEAQADSVSAAAAGSALSPEQWTRRIESLYTAGDEAGAAAALDEFRRVYPDADARLPPTLRAWATSVPRSP